MSESKFKIEFTLKQHTPMIHFQSDQKGATLRATELKPRFDRFLLEHVEGIPFKENANGYRSLDYKVKINAYKTIKSQHQTYIASRDRNNDSLKLGSYFGDNMSVDSNTIKVTFFSFKKKILDAIKKYFDEFISISSYGTRSNKGFGNFTNIKTNKSDFERYLRQHYIIFTSKASNDPLKSILSDYQRLKSGATGGVKSELMKYQLSQNIRWEKRWIKRRLLEEKEEWFDDLKDEYHETNDFNFRDDEQYFFVRALLGLAEQNEFLVNSNNKDKLIVKIENVTENSEIERYKSPITYKVYEKYIYLLINKNNPINNELFNKEFRFTAYYKSNKRDTCNLGILKTPSSFDIEAFLNEVSK